MFEWENSYQAMSNMVTGQDIFTKILSLSPQSLCTLQTKMSSSSSVSLADYRQFVAQFPEFARLLQARWLLQGYKSLEFHSPLQLYHVRLLLGVSWDDMMVLSALHSLLGGRTRKQLIAGTITILALALELYPANMSHLITNMACGFLDVIQRIDADNFLW
jgi:hypothetical protein